MLWFWCLGSTGMMHGWLLDKNGVDNLTWMGFFKLKQRLCPFVSFGPNAWLLVSYKLENTYSTKNVRFIDEALVKHIWIKRCFHVLSFLTLENHFWILKTSAWMLKLRHFCGGLYQNRGISCWLEQKPTNVNQSWKNCFSGWMLLPCSIMSKRNNGLSKCIKTLVTYIHYQIGFNCQCCSEWNS